MSHYLQKNAHSSYDDKKQILKAGQLYIRTNGATSETISSSQEMRDLLSRFIEKSKKLDEFLERYNLSINNNDFRFFQQLKTADRFMMKKINRKKDKRGYWQLIAYPQNFEENLIPDIRSISQLIKKTTILIERDSFPYIESNISIENFQHGKQAYYELQGLTWSFCKSGLFVYQKDFLREMVQDPDMKFLDPKDVIHTLTMFLLFLKNVYEELKVVSNIIIDISLHGCDGRTLRTKNGIANSKENRIFAVKENISIDQLTNCKHLVSKYARSIFEIFNIENFCDAEIDKEQIFLNEEIEKEKIYLLGKKQKKKHGSLSRRKSRHFIDFTQINGMLHFEKCSE